MLLTPSPPVTNSPVAPFGSGVGKQPSLDAPAELHGTGLAAGTPLHEITERLPAGIDRQLGYYAEAAWVLFYFDVRAEDIIWDDGHSYGISTGAWHVFENLVDPIAPRYRAEFGIGVRATLALVIYRRKPCAYFANLTDARRVVRSQQV